MQLRGIADDLLVGCGRYLDGHAVEHFKETGHTFALELDTQRVWDYAGDGYVHRLIQDKEGKLVEVSDDPTPPIDKSALFAIVRLDEC